MEKNLNEDEVIKCKHYITCATQQLTFHNGALAAMVEQEIIDNDIPFIAPGLIDLQINGINGIDFNNPSLTEKDVVDATHYLLSQGVTTFLPTIITNSDDNILKLVNIIYKACLADPIVKDCIYGIHLEGPFISPVAGAKGAHDEQYIKGPDWQLFTRFQQASGGTIKLITIAPEWEGSSPFIKQCRENGVLVSIGHSMAKSDQVELAVKSGASLSTHLGNGIPLQVQRHPNIIWDQLASDALHTCIITDGIHIPDSFIKVVIKNKGNATIVVSDATCFAGMAPGAYQTHIGGEVVLDENKRLSLKGSNGLLAGAATTLLENVETLVKKQLATLGDAWRMASENAAALLLKNDRLFDDKNDWVVFRLVDGKVVIERVIKRGVTVR